MDGGKEAFTGFFRIFFFLIHRGRYYYFVVFMFWSEILDLLKFIKIENNKEIPPTENIVMQVNSNSQYIFLQTTNFKF